jgi:hypothetical protein
VRQLVADKFAASFGMRIVLAWPEVNVIALRVRCSAGMYSAHRLMNTYIGKTRSELDFEFMP